MERPRRAGCLPPMGRRVQALTGVVAALAVGVTAAHAAGGIEPRKPAPDTLSFKLDDFKLSPKRVSTPAGAVKVKARNVGEATHELVVASTKRKPGNLPRTHGEVDEEALNVIGEVSEREPGESGTTTLNLKPGKYVMFCNVPGHYKAGMYGRITVK